MFMLWAICGWIDFVSWKLFICFVYNDMTYNIIVKTIAVWCLFFILVKKIWKGGSEAEEKRPVDGFRRRVRVGKRFIFCRANLLQRAKCKHYTVRCGAYIFVL